MSRDSIVFHQVTEPYFRFIHPLKQKNLQNIFRILPDSVDELWVFGSSVTHNHFPWSDLDILVIGDVDWNDRETIITASACPTDLLVCSKSEFEKHCNVFGHCYYRILREGIKYFDRSWL